MTIEELTKKSVVFEAPFEVAVRETPIAKLKPNELLVKNSASAVSHGTEMLVYRGEFPSEIPLDATIGGMQEKSGYPMSYGYACVGRVVAVGETAAKTWLGKQVFCFSPHSNYSVCPAAEAVELPAGVDPAQGTLFANLETAMTLILDGAPLLGERVAIVGQGLVGLLLTHLHQNMGLLAELTCFERCNHRQTLSQNWGAGAVFSAVTQQHQQAFDLVYEVTGSPTALNDAIKLATYDGRIVVGSFYGRKIAPINLGDLFHRNRLRIISSQVSTIAPSLRGRFDKKRIYDLVGRWLVAHDLSQLISHRFPLEKAAEVYRLIDQDPARYVQTVFTYTV